MIDPDYPAASWFLIVAPTLFLIVYAIPIFLMPFRWARLFRWKVNEGDDLALYYGRCLGALAIAVCVACLRAAPHPRQSAIIFDLITAAGAKLMYLPPYSPDFSPIELAWSKIKNQIRRTGARSAKALQQALVNAVQSITETDCLHWFRHCGYCVEGG